MFSLFVTQRLRRRDAAYLAGGDVNAYEHHHQHNQEDNQRHYQEVLREIRHPIAFRTLYPGFSYTQSFLQSILQIEHTAHKHGNKCQHSPSPISKRTIYPGVPPKESITPTSSRRVRVCSQKVPITPRQRLMRKKAAIARLRR